MDNLQKQLCKNEVLTEEQVLTEIFSMIKGEYIAQIHNNTENITLKFLNGQRFKITVQKM